MFKQSCFNAEQRGYSLKGLVQKLVAYKAFAEEVGEGGSNGGTPAPNFEQLIAQARKEEKDKLYPRITKLEDENKKLVQSANAYLLEIGALKTEIAELKSKDDNSAELERLKTEVAKLEATNQDLVAKTPKEDDIRAQVKAEIEKEYEVKLYMQEQVNANKDEILSVFQSDVSGKTKEEVDQSIESAKQKSINIKKDLGLVDKDGNPTKKAPVNKGGKTNPPASNPKEETGVGEYDFDYVQGLDPRSDEYKEFRKKMGLK